MDDLLKRLAQQSAEILLIALILIVGLLAWCWTLSAKQRKFLRRWRELMDGATGSNLETLLYDHLRERMGIEAELDSLRARVKELESLARTAKRYVGLVRFDAFEDVGGNQSFALAVYDEQGDGAVLTSIVGRQTARVYCKPLQGGRSERDLSQEEQRALREARATGPRPIVSP